MHKTSLFVYQLLKYFILSFVEEHHFIITGLPYSYIFIKFGWEAKNN
jgi:hypothetical protein